MLTQKDIYGFAKARYDRANNLSRLAMACQGKGDLQRARQLSMLSTRECHLGNQLMDEARTWSVEQNHDAEIVAQIEAMRAR